jgi:5-methylcytosine-specific restriction endonuclease McrA
MGSKPICLVYFVQEGNTMSRKNEEIREMRQKVFDEQGGRCGVCGFPVLLVDYPHPDQMELAHIIPQRGWCIRRWGADVIHHRKNLVGTHPAENSSVQIDPNSLEAERLAAEIRKELNT